MRGHAFACVVFVVVSACSAGDRGNGDRSGDVNPSSEVTVRPGSESASTTVPPFTADAVEPDGTGDVGEPVAPFEPEATTPAEDGVDIDDVLREERGPAPTTPPIEQPTVAPPLEPRLEPLEPGPLAWTLRRTPRPGDTSVDLLVDERGCDGDRATADRLEVSVRETSDRVEIGVTRRDGVGADRRPCPTAPLTPLTVTLDNEVGERRLAVVDGRLGAAATPLDDVPDLLAVRVTTDAAPIVPVSRNDVADTGFLLTLDCADGLTGSDWRPTIEFGAPEFVIAEAAATLGLGAAPWHEFVVDDGDDRGAHHQWTVVAAGSPVALVVSRPGIAGWTATARACASLDPIDADTQLNPRLGRTPGGALPPTVAPTITAAQIADIDGLAVVAGSDGALRWVDPSSRCRGWLALEDGLVAAGFVLGSERTTIDPAELAEQTPGGEPIAVTRQSSRRVDGPDGTAALLTTTADGRIVLRAVAQRDGAVHSRLQPCRLDGPVSTVRVVAT